MRRLRAVLACARGGGPARTVGARLVRPLGLALGGLGDVLLLAGVDGLAIARARTGRRGRALAVARRAVRRLDPAERRVALLGVEHRRPLGRLGERALVVARHDLAPRAAQRLPLAQDSLGERAAGALAVLLHERTDLGEVIVGRLLEVYEAAVEVRGELALGIEHVGDPAAHAGGEVAPGRAEHDHAAAGHVLAAVVTRALDDRAGARVAHREALAGEPAEERAPARRPVQHGVADDHVLLGDEARALRRTHREHAARQALAGVVVRVAVEGQRHPRREPPAEALAARAVRGDLDRPLGQSL